MRKFISFFYILIFSLVVLFPDLDHGQSIVFYLAAISSLVFIFYNHGKNKSLIPLLIFSSTYTLYLYPFYFSGIPYHYLTETQTLNNTNFILAGLHLLYQVLFYPTFNRLDYNIINGAKIRMKKNIFFVFILVLSFGMPLAVYVSPPNLSIDYNGEIVSSVWIEYGIIFLMFIVFSDKSEKYRLAVFFVIALYLIYPLLYSRRLQFLMVVLLIYYRYFIGPASYKKIYFYGFIVFVAMRIYESSRMGVVPTLSSFLTTTNSDGVEGSNQGGVTVASTVYYELINNGTFDYIFRIKSFFGNLMTGFLPSSINFTETYVNISALKYLPLPGNGGYPSVYFYLWGGIIGIYFGAYLLSVGLLYSGKSKFNYLVAITILATCPRWHSYNLLITVKSITIIFLVLLALRLYEGVKAR